MKTLNESFNSISVKKGEKFAIELGENPSTGFQWGVDVSKGRAEFNYSSFKRPKGPMAVGAGGKRKFVFTATEAGDVEITAEYKRAWEGEAAQTQKFKVSVK